MGLDFASAPVGQLDELERRTIQHLEREGVGLFNAALVGLPMGKGPFDLVVERVEQERWLDEGAEAAYEGDGSKGVRVYPDRERAGPKEGSGR